MTTQTLTLTDFLLARIAEDESVANQSLSLGDSGGGLSVDRDGHVAIEIGPDRVLAECEAKRRIVATHTRGTDEWRSSRDLADWHLCSCSGDYPCRTLRALALPYADHPDYREEWRS